jgi:hypothetical protein
VFGLVSALLLVFVLLLVAGGSAYLAYRFHRIG